MQAGHHPPNWVGVSSSGRFFRSASKFFIRLLFKPCRVLPGGHDLMAVLLHGMNGLDDAMERDGPESNHLHADVHPAGLPIDVRVPVPGDVVDVTVNRPAIPFRQPVGGVVNEEEPKPTVLNNCRVLGVV